MRYIDEKCEDIVKSQIGLNIPINILKSCLQEKRQNFLVEIKHSKSQEAPINFESNNFDLEEPLSKKIKGPVRYINEKCEDIVKSQIGLNSKYSNKVENVE